MHRRRHAHGAGPVAGSDECPLLVGAQAHITCRPVLREIVHRAGRAVAGEVVGRGDDDASREGQLLRDQRRICEAADADRKVVAAADDVDHAVVEVHRRHDAGVLAQEWLQRRHQVAHAEGVGGGDPEGSGEALPALADELRRFPEVLDDALAALVEKGARVRQRLAPGGPLDQ